MGSWGFASVRAGILVASFLTPALVAAPALAQATCSPSLDRTVTTTGTLPATTIVSVTTDLDAGAQLNFVVTFTAGAPGSFLDVVVDASPGDAQNGTQVVVNDHPGPGNGSFTAGADGSYTFNYVAGTNSIETVGNVAVTCSGGGGGGVGGGSTELSAIDAANEAMEAGHSAARPSTAPGALPVAAGTSDARVDALTREIAEKEREIEEAELRLVGIEFARATMLLGNRSVPGEEVRASMEFNNLRAEAKVQESSISAARSLIDKYRAEIERLRNGGVQAAPTEPELTLDEGEGILYFPRPRDPVSAAFRAITDASGGGRANSSLELQLEQYVLWARFNASVSAGTADRSGIGAGAQAGVVVAIDPRLDVGAFLMGYGSTQKADAVDGTLDSVTLGAGVYMTYDLTDNVTTGLTLSAERGFHDSTVGDVTGSFTRDTVRLEGSLSGDYLVGDVVVAPSAGFEWLYSSRSSYEDSAAMVHPVITSNEFVGTLGIEVRRSFIQDFADSLIVVTPRAGLALSGHAGREATLDLGGGVTVDQSNVYLAASTGLAVDFGDGLNADFGLALGGIGDSVQSLSATASLRAPLN